MFNKCEMKWFNQTWQQGGLKGFLSKDLFHMARVNLENTTSLG